MTVSRALAVSSLLLSYALAGAPSALAEAQPREPVAKSAPVSAAPFVQLAQKADKEAKDKADEKDAKGAKGDDKKKKGHRPPDKGSKGGKDAKGPGAPPKKDHKKKAADQKPPKAEGKPNAFNKKPVERRPDAVNIIPKINADAARKKKEQQLKIQDAKQKAQQKKIEAEAARQNVLKEKQKQLKAQQDKENALKNARDAQAARDNATKQKQIDAKQAKDKALKQQDASRPDKGKGKGKRKPAKFDKGKADQEFDRARKDAQKKSGGPNEKWGAQSARKFEDLRKGRKTRDVGSRSVIVEQDKRTIISGGNRNFIRHDEGKRFVRKGKEVRRERRKDGTWMVVTAGLAGALIYSILDDDGRALRRSRRDRDGREYIMFDDRRSYRNRDNEYYDDYIDLPPPVVRIPRDRYIVNYDEASVDDIYDALNAPPVEDLDRGYSLDDIRYNYSILERMRRVDLTAINFEFASWDIGEDQYSKLERMARAMQRVLDRSPGELFLIEGHTDAVGNEIDNLSLSDRRAEAVAIVLTDTFGIPPENLTTQGYGEDYLKEDTDGPSWVNRRVAVRRITPLLSREGWDEDDDRG